MNCGNKTSAAPLQSFLLSPLDIILKNPYLYLVDRRNVFNDDVVPQVLVGC